MMIGIVRRLLLAALLGSALAACTDQAVHSPALAPDELTRLGPDPRLDPAEVVRIQLEALQRNSALSGDGGIRIAFRFASAGNQASTGPIERFIALLHGPSYDAMLDHRSAALGELVRDGERAAQRVTITTRDFRTLSYVFVLRREATASCAAGCWVTDAVHRWPEGEPAAPRRVHV
ncbi:DUF4864 domain-containing protein [Spiribacter halobius]|uniref:DUF4864 domain-containing protein n=1 Tax=Sediminicurvatus halobius TaxID=2182432 RepID=A0A2U2N0H2_9GAMM|nr:DUF4864 domain-containing protein [Spiribacter halobius]PWG62562.1 hypothetical protein DEM34_11460 [Spiribacter halobius]UEX78524.1 DUF4864 domain-containing protein [Spiribacter halobius]